MATTPSLFGDLDQRSEEEILRDKYRAQVDRFNETVPVNAPQSYQDMYRAGGLLGTALSRKFAPQTLTEQERARTTAVQSAKTRIDEWRKANPDQPLDAFGLEQQKIMAEELFRAGDYQAGGQLAVAYTQNRIAQRQAELELEKLGLQNESRRRENEYWHATNTMKEIYLPGETQQDSPRSAFIHPDGSAEFVDPVTGETKIIPRGGYSWTAPKNGPGGAIDPDDIRKIITPSLRMQMVRLNTSIESMARSYLRMHRILSENVQNQGTVNMLSRAGRAQSWVTDFANSITAGYRSIGSVFGVQNRGNLANPSEARQYVRDNPQLVESLKPSMPKEIADVARLAEEWASAATQLAYAVGTAAEPGQRAMTDQDFNVRVQQIGASTSDPETFRRIAVDTFENTISEFETTLAGYPAEFHDHIVAPAARTKARTAIDDFYKIYSPSFGTAEQPGPGIAAPADDDALVQQWLAPPQ